MQVLRISDWTRLIKLLPPQCAPTDVRKVFYPKVPSYDPITAGSVRDDTFLILFDDVEYHAAYRRVQNALPLLKFHNIRTILKASAQEGQKVKKLMCHIVQWFDPSFEEGRGLQLWERLNLDESEDSSDGRKIQLAIFQILRGRTKELDVALLKEMPSAEPATYLKRFDTPSIWSEILQKVKELTNTPLRGPFEGVEAGDASIPGTPGTPGSAMPQSSQATFPSTAAVLEQAFQRTWETTVSIRKHPVLGRPEAATALLRKIAEWKNEQYNSFEKEESLRGPKRRRFQEDEADEEDEEEADKEDEEEADEEDEEDEEENSEVENDLVDIEAESGADEESHRQILSSERDSEDEDLLPGEE
jgi:hypothetical protein